MSAMLDFIKTKLAIQVSAFGFQCSWIEKRATNGGNGYIF